MNSKTANHVRKQAKTFADLDQPGSNNNPILKQIKSQGHFPPSDLPIGWDGEGFRKIFPTKDLPFQTVDEIMFDGNSKNENRLIWGDNLAIMRSLPDASVDLIYIDPPFFSGRNYKLIFGDEAEERTFRDIWDGGLQTYLAWLNARLYEMKRLLSERGSLFLHVDWHAAHYLKVELDKIFGTENFRNEIIWYYRRWTNASKDFQKMHDVIFKYSKSKNYLFNKLYQPYSETTVHREMSVDGKTNLSKSRDVEKGVVMHDVWEVPYVHSQSKERIGYPTQKPEALLERIVLSSSNPGDVVADFFSGGGTTLAVAQKLGRRWIGCDISKTAIQITADRLANIKNNLPQDKDGDNE